ncbi:hypothetical protein EJ05DRAFT_501464 [Pseudovirgaria hyperparasitica]|uniref:Uncharacterized protein n=1 Tax=Pseudovirgaria hyperparasitica TaxID=470096 RepID=A0A6A6W1X0_9PEZI|nr:uncharacterized protein EJ05DRAFT_501464 [Pseudovirgaria hyperparasitica]KAF2756918.1 hypothetical protein EJ05DRAFT_501464 [Pseudovirgaria hyperparasitica]
MTVKDSPQTLRASPQHEKDATTPKIKIVTPKPTEKTTAKASGLKLGAGPGPIDPKSVQDKVRKWQTTGGGVVVTPDSNAAPDNDRIKDKPESPRKGTKDKEITPVAPKVEIRVKSASKPRHNTLDDELRDAIAPKKRVVSDGHWRKNRSPPKEGKPIGWVRERPKAKPVEEEETEQKVISKIPDHVANESNVLRKRRQSAAVKAGIEAFKTEEIKPTKANKPVRDWVETIETSKISSSSSRHHELSSPVTTPVEIRTPRRRRRSSPKFDHSEDAAQVPSSEESAERTPTRHRRKNRRSPRASDNVEEASKPTMPEGENVEPPDSRKRLQKKRELSLSKAKDPDAPVGVHPTRIEAWLDTTSDPFVEAKTKSRGSSIISSQTGSSSVSTHTYDSRSSISRTDQKATSDRDKDAESGKKRRRRSRRSPTSSEGTATEDSQQKHEAIDPSRPDTKSPPAKILNTEPESSSSPLKRSGARRSAQSPTKARPRTLQLHETYDDGSVVSSAPSSSVEGSMFDAPEPTARARPTDQFGRRAFPTTGKRLSTIASVDTFNARMQRAPSIAQGSEPAESVLDDTKSSATVKSRRSVRNKTVSHADLMSVLSLPRSKSKSLVSAHSIRTSRTRLETATIQDLMKELSSDEDKYKRELNTLVDGVIPVLLACVLSKSDAAVAAGLFSTSASKQDPNSTKPIVDMGIALERLKSLHRRIPLEDDSALLSWAQSAQRIYTDYIKTWRLGFQNVVVNLAPASEDSPTTKTLESHSKPSKSAWDEGLPRNAEGYVVNDDGERVDVAFLLKRPLVRLKWLAKTFKGINFLKPSEKAETTSLAFQDLVLDARKRNNEERARMEDEAAASIDPTRARDPKSLTALQGVAIDPARCVRARDYFDMHLLHTSGQEIDCRVELLLRDDPPANGTGGDVLICDLDSADRWLFFPPIQTGRISARKGDSPEELVVMIRGLQSGGEEWKEVFVLKSTDEDSALEWIQMLGDSPVPPPLAQISSAASFVSKSSLQFSSYDSSLVSSAYTASTAITSPARSRNPSPREFDVPLGEPVRGASRRWSQASTPTKNTGHRLEDLPKTPPSKEREESTKTPNSSARQSRNENAVTPRDLNEAMQAAGTDSTGLRRSKATRFARSTPTTPTMDAPIPEESEPDESIHGRMRSYSSTPQATAKVSKDYSVWYPPSNSNDHEDEPLDDTTCRKRESLKESQRPVIHRRASSVPSTDLPMIPRVRTSSQHDTVRAVAAPLRMDRSESAPVLPAKVEQDLSKDPEDSPPPPPPHRSPPKTGLSNLIAPILSPFRTKRRSSSPLKHEYEPSTATESSSESENNSSDDEGSIISESSEDSLDEEFDVPVEPPPPTPPHMQPAPRPNSSGSLPETSLGPSSSASQKPYRDIPGAASIAYKGVANIFTWREEPGRVASWEPLSKEPCSVVIKPGFIEVFELNQAHAQPELNDSARPLLALGLTPNVLVHRGTNIDIDIRSPPLGLSLLKAGGRTMFRSLFPMASEELWQAVRWSRENNPTFIALQNARGQEPQVVTWAAQQDMNNAARPDTRAGKPRWSLPASLSRSRSYRASSTRALSINSSVESKSSFFSSLKRFGGSGRFSIARSSVDYRGSPSTVAVDMTTEASGSSSGGSTPMSPDGRAANVPIGVSNTKIRFHKSSGQRRWNDLGKARLHIMAPTEVSPLTPGDKRILVVTKGGAVLLDATVPENAFEIYGRVGIAVKVVEDIVGKDGTVGGAAATGGVGSKRLVVYMLQFKSNRQCKYNFLQLGKMRY